MSDLIEALYNTCEGDEESIMYQAAEIIEQLQAQVVELERDLTLSTDQNDLLLDEFIRVKHLTDNEEIHGLCERAHVRMRQKVSVIDRNFNQKQEITHLKRQLKEAQNERDALAAHVERLRAAGTNLRDDIDLSKIVGSSRRNFATEWDAVCEQSPTTSLAERDAEVARKAYEQGVYDACECENQEMSLDEIESWAPDAANEYAERVKRGEV